MDEVRPDYIIVGSGAAGSVLASRLSENPGRRVVVIEAGGSERHPFISIPGAVMYALAMPRFDWGFYSEADPTRAGKVEHWPRGRVVGGSASINGMVFVRGQQIDFDDWESHGASGWGYDDVLPYFKRLESTSIGSASTRGRSGPVAVSEAWSIPAFTRSFIDACRAQGIPANADYNGQTQEGVGPCQANLRGGHRDSAARAYLRPALKRPNLRIVGKAMAARILFDGNRAVGVEYEQGGALRRLYCEREVIVAAGAIGSPHLLMMSGIGPTGVLAANGIPVVAASEGVGRNLMDHAAFLVARKATLPSLNLQGRGLRRIANGARWLALRNGPATAIASQGLAFVRTLPSLSYPDVQITFSSTAYSFAGGKVRLADTNGMMMCANVSRPKSRGFVDLRSPNFRDAPAIHPRMFSDADDLETLLRGVRKIEQIFASAPLSRIVESSSEDMHWETDDELRAFLQANAHVIYHPAGTCRMGGNDAVVDPDLRVRGVTGLRVIDASVFPSMVSGNTNAAVMMIGEKGSDLIVEAEANDA